VNTPAVGLVALLVGFALGWAPSAYRAWRFRRTLQQCFKAFGKIMSTTLGPKLTAPAADAPAPPPGALPYEPGELGPDCPHLQARGAKGSCYPCWRAWRDLEPPIEIVEPAPVQVNPWVCDTPTCRHYLSNHGPDGCTLVIDGKRCPCLRPQTTEPGRSPPGSGSHKPDVPADHDGLD